MKRDSLDKRSEPYNSWYKYWTSFSCIIINNQRIPLIEFHCILNFSSNRFKKRVFTVKTSHAWPPCRRGVGKNVSASTEGAISFQFCSISMNTWRNKLFSIIKLSYQINDCELRPARPRACMHQYVVEKYLESMRNNEKIKTSPTPINNNRKINRAAKLDRKLIPFRCPNRNEAERVRGGNGEKIFIFLLRRRKSLLTRVIFFFSSIFFCFLLYPINK